MKSLPFFYVCNPIWFVKRRKKRFKKLFYKFIDFIINYDFYVITL